MSSAWVVGRRRAVHESQGVSRANRPLFRGRCNVDASEDADPPLRELTDHEFAQIVAAEPRRLCGHDYPTRDRAGGTR
ncbi:MAG TPA: hypothetical protein VJZ72_00055 [Candidatus Limnocylindrales bacterium]|nr:hypothetical protein [Candidatus Limnocylindrales bacterium]